MSKAEDRYLEHFQDGRLRNCSSKEAFLLGYHQAEKDNELTWEDIPEIFRISGQLKTSWWFRDNEQTKQIGTQVFWEEVLKRFNKERGKDEQD